MAIHPSLALKGKNKRTHSVLKRFERLKELKEREKWNPQDSVFGLPKVKTVHWKLKKVKKAQEAATPTAEQATAAPAKEAAPKKTEASVRK